MVFRAVGGSASWRPPWRRRASVLASVRAMTGPLSIAIGVWAALSQPAAAQPAMKPGLWETRISSPQMDASMKQMQERLAAMPPAQRAQFEQMMSQKGVAMGPGGAVRHCRSAESMRQSGPMQAETGCTVTPQFRADGGSFEMRCQDGRTGRGEFRMQSPEQYQGWIEGSDPRRPGQAFRMEHSGRWLSADCGNLKPAGGG